MLKKATLHPPSPVRAETHTCPELRSRLANILNVPHGKERVLARLGWAGEIGQRLRCFLRLRLCWAVVLNILSFRDFYRRLRFSIHKRPAVIKIPAPASMAISFVWIPW
jgi:hypothetical protein